MTRIKTAVSLLIVISAICAGSMMFIKNFTSNIYELTENIISAMEEGDRSAASGYADEILEYWEKSSYILNTIVRKDKLVSVYTSLVRLKPLIDSSSDEVYAEIRSINAMLGFISENEFPYIV